MLTQTQTVDALESDLDLAAALPCAALISGGTREDRRAAVKRLHERGELVTLDATALDDRTLKQRLSHCHSGTLVLEDVDQLGWLQQRRLAAFLEHRPHERPRVIATAQSPLFRLVTEGCFLEELFYRLNVVHVHYP